MTNKSLRASITFVDIATQVTHVVPVAMVSHVLLTVAASMETSGRYRYVQDMAVVADIARFGMDKPVADTQAFFDTVTLEAKPQYTDSVSFSDVCVPTLIFIRGFSDTLTSSDAKVVAYSKPVTESVSLGDVETYGYTKALTDAFAMNDMADIGDGIAFDFQDYTNNVVTVSDSSVVTAQPGVLDSFSLTDSQVLLFSPAYFESVTQSDALVRSIAPRYADSIVLTDNTTTGFSKVLSDTFGQSDTAALTAYLTKTDSISQTESGLIAVQDYVDPTYLAGDYVGATYTF